MDREQDLSVSGEPHEVGGTFGARWAERLPCDQAEDLLARLEQTRPRIPRSLDGELLRYAARFGTIGNEALDISDDHRMQLRAGFWHGIEQLTGTSRTRASSEARNSQGPYGAPGQTRARSTAPAPRS